MTNRRRLLELSGTALLASVAGCASIVKERANGEATRTTTDGAPTSAPERTNTTTAATEGDVSNADDANSSAETAAPPLTVDSPDVTFSRSLLPDDPGDFEYARLGGADAPVTATLYGNWKCPYTREFVLDAMEDVVAEFVDPGDVALEFRALSYRNGEPFLGDDAPRAARAGLEVWRSSPERYWSYFASVFTNQPDEIDEWATTDNLLRLAEAAEISDLDAVGEAIVSGDHRDAVRATTERAAARNVTSVPRLATRTAVTAPTVDIEDTRRQLRRAVRR